MGAAVTGVACGSNVVVGGADVFASVVSCSLLLWVVMQRCRYWWLLPHAL